MRVLIVTGTLPPAWCGVGDHAARLAAALARAADTEVAVLTTEGDAPSAGVAILRTPSWRALRTPAMFRQIRQWHPDIVHFQYPTRGYGRQLAPWLLPSLCRLAGIPIVFTWHELPARHAGEIPNALLPGGVIVVRQQYEEQMTPFYRWMTRRKKFRFIEIASTIPFVDIPAKERERIRNELARPGDTIVAYFGFAYPHKGVEQLLEIADPERDVVLLIGELDERNEYQRQILARTREPRWKGRSVVTGWVSADRAATLLAVADAVVFPFRQGTDTWNSSVRGAIGQGTFVAATSSARRGYDEEQNVFHAAPDDLAAMRDAVRRYAGVRRAARTADFDREWDAIAAAHLQFYRELILG